MNGSERKAERPSPAGNGATWRTACAFSLLALVTMIALTSSDWPFTGPAGALVESMLKAAVWLYIFALCTISICLAATALKRHRRDGNLVETCLAALALFIGGVVTLLVYNRFWI